MAKSNKLKLNNSTSVRRRSRKNKGQIFLDYASAVFPNPSSLHMQGVDARIYINNSRSKIATILNSLEDEIIFTSGGTESNNLAILGLISAFEKENKKKPHCITTNIEHPSVLEAMKAKEEQGEISLTIVPVGPDGVVDPRDVKEALSKNTILVSVMLANNEIGTIQPVKEISKAIRHYKKINNITTRYPVLHTDAIQAVNYLELNVEKLGVDMLTLSGAKIKDAGRIGVLYKKRNIKIAPILYGGDQEFGLRPGTENVQAIWDFANALAFVSSIRDKESKRLQVIQEYFLTSIERSKILKNFNIILNGDRKNRLPNNLNFTFGSIPSDLMVIELSQRGIMASPQSACKSGRGEGSYVIEALSEARSLAYDREVGGVRFSFGETTTKKEIVATIRALEEIISKLSDWYKK